MDFDDCGHSLPKGERKTNRPADTYRRNSPVTTFATHVLDKAVTLN